MNNRTDWVDYGKGIGIVLVAYAHLLSSAYHAGVKIPERFFNLSDSVVYGFHMPFFFFLSGLFVEISFRKRDASAYLFDKFSRIAYPYFIWSVLQVSVEALFSSQTQMGASASDVPAVAYRPWGQFWFLYALFLMHVAYVAFNKFGKYSPALTLTAALALFFYPLQVDVMALSSFSIHFIFFASGVVFRKQILESEKYNAPLWIVVLSLAILIGSGYFIFDQLVAPARLTNGTHPFYFLYLSILGIIACANLAQYLAKRNLALFIQTLGIYSLQIYLVHMLAGVGIRMILLSAGVQNWMVHIVVGVAVALTAPIVMQKISDRINFPYLFEFRKSK